jgi:hypothetical protein
MLRNTALDPIIRLLGAPWTLGKNLCMFNRQEFRQYLCKKKKKVIIFNGDLDHF